MNPVFHTPPIPILYRRERHGNREPFAVFPTLQGPKGPDWCLTLRADGTTGEILPDFSGVQHADPACPDREPGVARLRDLAASRFGLLRTVLRMNLSHHETRTLKGTKP